MTFGHTGVQVTGSNSVPHLMIGLEVAVFFTCTAPLPKGHGAYSLGRGGGISGPARGMAPSAVLCDSERVPLPGRMQLGRAWMLRGQSGIEAHMLGASPLKVPFQTRICKIWGQPASGSACFTIYSPHVEDIVKTVMCRRRPG